MRGKRMWRKEPLRFVRRTPLHVAAFLVFACLALSVNVSTGCRSSITSLDEIDSTVRNLVSNLERCGDFVDSLESITLGDASFIEVALERIRDSREASADLLADVELLRKMRYGGETAHLGEVIRELCEGTTEAVEELSAVWEGLEGILGAVKPVFLQEIAVPLGMVTEHAEIIKRLENLMATADQSLRAVNEVAVPELLEGYRSFWVDLIEAVKAAAQNSIDLLRGRDTGSGRDESGSSAVNSLLWVYPELAGRTFGALQIRMMEPLVEQVELEINRLFLREKD